MGVTTVEVKNSPGVLLRVLIGSLSFTANSVPGGTEVAAWLLGVAGVCPPDLLQAPEKAVSEANTNAAVVVRMRTSRPTPRQVRCRYHLHWAWQGSIPKSVSSATSSASRGTSLQTSGLYPMVCRRQPRSGARKVQPRGPSAVR